MKQRRFTFLLIALLSLTGFEAYAHDIEVANSDGVTIYYVYQNNKTELAVSFRGRDYYISEYAGDVVIPESVTYNGTIYPVTSIGKNAFWKCNDLTSVTIPNSVTSIGDLAFYGCGLTSIMIPSSVTSIGARTFTECTGLTTVTIPASVTSIGENPFSRCSNLTSVTVDVNNPNYDSRNNCNAIIETRTNKLVTGCDNTIIPSDLNGIGSSAFENCSFTSVMIPSCVTSIGHSAFRDCI